MAEVEKKKVMSRALKKEETKQRIIQALQESQGLLTLAAKKAGVSYSTIYKYAHDIPEVHEAVWEAKERIVDTAESKLFEAIQQGQSWAICFFLKTQGFRRGYVEHHEVSGADGQPLPDTKIVFIIGQGYADNSTNLQSDKQEAK